MTALKLGSTINFDFIVSITTSANVSSSSSASLICMRHMSDLSARVISCAYKQTVNVHIVGIYLLSSRFRPLHKPLTFSVYHDMVGQSNVENFLMGLLHEFHWHIRQAGCFANTPTDYPQPTLTNAILPMFSDRWARGTNQHFDGTGLRPGIVLASRMLTEYWTLMWFSKLTFGERHSSPSNPGIKYITPTTYQYTPAAIAEVKENFAEFGEVVTLMFAPRSCKKTAWGMTYNHKLTMPFHAEFKESDMPEIKQKYKSSTYRRNRPFIVMNAYFMDYFKFELHKSTTSEHYRVVFAFAITLVHEVAHAYYIWLNERLLSEPLWDQSERNNELGYLWERYVMGRVIQPFRIKKAVNDGIRMFLSTKLWPFTNPTERLQVLYNGYDTKNLKMTTRDAHGVRRTWPVRDPSQFRGSELFIHGNCDTYVAGIQCIPMWWIVQWFREDFWVEQVRQSDQKRRWDGPVLNDAFTIIYEREKLQTWIHRPLNFDAPMDVQIYNNAKASKSQR